MTLQIEKSLFQDYRVLLESAPSFFGPAVIFHPPVFSFNVIFQYQGAKHVHSTL
jgi:hypothetical protein